MNNMSMFKEIVKILKDNIVLELKKLPIIVESDN